MGKWYETAVFALESWDDGSSYGLTSSLAVGSTADTLATPHPLKPIGLAQILTRARLSTLNTLTRIAIIHYWVCASVHSAILWHRILFAVHRFVAEFGSEESLTGSRRRGWALNSGT
jgi:hypothetical protein